MKNKEKSKFNGKTSLVISGIVILFLISFTSASWIYIKSNDLVFKDTIEDYEEKYKKVDEAEKRIAELEAQLERYKSLYEGAVKDNKVLSATTNAQPSKTTVAIEDKKDTKEDNNIKEQKEDNVVKDEKDDNDIKEEKRTDKSKSDKEINDEQEKNSDNYLNTKKELKDTDDTDE